MTAEARLSEPRGFVPVVMRKPRGRYRNAHNALPSPYSQAWEDHKKKSFKLARFLGLK